VTTTSTTDLEQIGAPRTAPPTIAQFVELMKPQIARALPKGIDADRIVRLALTSVRKNPQLAECTLESFGGALMTATALGLEPDVNGEAYLVPYRDRNKGITECTFIMGYQGVTKLFWQHPLARHIDAQAVHERDEFDYAYGLDPFLRHKPATGDRGDIIYYYAVAALANGARSFVVLSPDDVKKLRGGKVGPDPRFKGGDPMHWMERKTAVKQLAKLLPKSTALAQALQVDEQPGSVLAANHTAQQIYDHQPLAELEQAAPDGVDPVTGEVDGWPETTQIPAS
jgi:recombination protein RecT